MPLQCSEITVSFRALGTFKLSNICVTSLQQIVRVMGRWLMKYCVMWGRLKMRRWYCWKERNHNISENLSFLKLYSSKSPKIRCPYLLPLSLKPIIYFSLKIWLLNIQITIIYSLCVSSVLFARLLSVHFTIATHKEGYLKITTEVKNQ
jgi:hypothetical protein